MTVIVQPRRSQVEHRLYLAASVGILAVVVIGFARTCFLKLLFDAPALSWLVELHGGLMTSWLALTILQAALVSTRRVSWHRRLGIGGAVLAANNVIVGAIVVVRFTDRELHAAHGLPTAPLI